MGLILTDLKSGQYTDYNKSYTEHIDICTKEGRQVIIDNNLRSFPCYYDIVEWKPCSINPYYHKLYYRNDTIYIFVDPKSDEFLWLHENIDIFRPIFPYTDEGDEVSRRHNLYDIPAVKVGHREWNIGLSLEEMKDLIENPDKNLHDLQNMFGLDFNDKTDS